MKLKLFVSNFYLKSYINITNQAKVYMALLIPNKNTCKVQVQSTLATFLLTALFVIV